MLHYDLLKFLLPYVTGANARTRTPSTKKRKQIVSNIIYIRNDSDENGAEYIRAMEDEGSIEEMDVHETLSDDPNLLEEIQIKGKPNLKAETVEVVPCRDSSFFVYYTDIFIDYFSKWCEWRRRKHGDLHDWGDNRYRS